MRFVGGGFGIGFEGGRCGGGVDTAGGEFEDAHKMHTQLVDSHKSDPRSFEIPEGGECKHNLHTDKQSTPLTTHRDREILLGIHHSQRMPLHTSLSLSLQRGTPTANNPPPQTTQYKRPTPHPETISHLPPPSTHHHASLPTHLQTPLPQPPLHTHNHNHHTNTNTNTHNPHIHPPQTPPRRHPSTPPPTSIKPSCNTSPTPCLPHASLCPGLVSVPRDPGPAAQRACVVCAA